MPVVLSTMRTNKAGWGDRQQWGGSNVPLSGDIQRPEWSRGGKPCRHRSWTAYSSSEGSGRTEIIFGRETPVRQWQHWEYLIFFPAFSVHVLSERYPVGSEDLKQWSSHSSSHQDLALGRRREWGKVTYDVYMYAYVYMHAHAHTCTHKLSNVTFSRRMVTAQLSPRWEIDP